MPSLGIDRALYACLRAELKGKPASLTLERFCQQWNVPRASIAIRAAVGDIHRRYRAAFGMDSNRVLVRDLCKLLGVRVHGSPSASLAATTTVAHQGRVRFRLPSEATVEIPSAISMPRARLIVAHEIGHVLIHRRNEGRLDDITIRLPSSPEEEALAEYAARLLLLPGRLKADSNLALSVRHAAQRAAVTMFAAAGRLGDPDQERAAVRGAIYWECSSDRCSRPPRPKWDLCPDEFIPRSAVADPDSVVASLAAAVGPATEVREEVVSIGSLTGRFRVHGCAWDNVRKQTRSILSVLEALPRCTAPKLTTRS